MNQKVVGAVALGLGVAIGVTGATLWNRRKTEEEGLDGPGNQPGPRPELPESRPNAPAPEWVANAPSTLVEEDVGKIAQISRTQDMDLVSPPSATPIRLNSGDRVKILALTDRIDGPMRYVQVVFKAPHGEFMGHIWLDRSSLEQASATGIESREDRYERAAAMPWDSEPGTPLDEATYRDAEADIEITAEAIDCAKTFASLPYESQRDLWRKFFPSDLSPDDVTGVVASLPRSVSRWSAQKGDIDGSLFCSWVRYMASQAPPPRPAAGAQEVVAVPVDKLPADQRAILMGISVEANATTRTPCGCGDVDYQCRSGRCGGCGGLGCPSCISVPDEPQLDAPAMTFRFVPDRDRLRTACVVPSDSPFAFALDSCGDKE